MSDNFLNDFLKAIEDNDVITLWRHIYPDPDAWGSQLGMKAWIEANWPDKTVLALGDYIPDRMDQADDQTIEDSLAIILDTSTSERIDNDRWKKAKDSIRIDHHHPVETIANLELLDEKATATCELVTDLIAKSKKPIPKEAAELLYAGLLADTNQFSNSNMRPEAFDAAKWLMENADLDLTMLNESVIGSSFEEFKFSALIKTRAVLEGALLFACIFRQDYLALGKPFAFAKGRVNALAHVDEAKIWGYFVENEEGLWDVSLRAKSIPVRDIAESYGGGGHVCAAACKHLSQKQLLELIAKLKARTGQNPDDVQLV